MIYEAVKIFYTIYIRVVKYEGKGGLMLSPDEPKTTFAVTKKVSF